jgi:hypothetical protein
MTPLLIIGAPRSGTTFLAQIVSRFLDLHVVRDGGVFRRFFRLLPRYGDLSDRFNLRGLIDDLYRDYIFRRRIIRDGLRLDPQALCEKLSAPDYAALIDGILTETARHHGRRGWGNKTTAYALLQKHEFDAMFPTARIVHILRDGRDVALSMRNASHLLVDRNWYFAARGWRRHVREGRRLGMELGAGRYLEIRYEDLVQRPLDAFAELRDFTGAGIDLPLPRIGSRLEKLVKPDNAGKWRTQIPDPALRTIERAAGDLLSELGYEPRYPALRGQAFSAPAVALFRLDDILRRLFSPAAWKLLVYPAQSAATRFRGWFR